MEKRNETKLGSIYIHLCFMEAEPVKEMTQKKVIVITGHRRGQCHQGGEGEGSEKKGRSIKPHKGLRSQGPRECQSTGVLEEQFQFHVQTATGRKQVSQRSGRRFWVTGIEQASVRSKIQNKEVQSVQNVG